MKDLIVFFCLFIPFNTYCQVFECDEYEVDFEYFAKYNPCAQEPSIQIYLEVILDSTNTYDSLVSNLVNIDDSTISFYHDIQITDNIGQVSFVIPTYDTIDVYSLNFLNLPNCNIELELNSNINFYSPSTPMIKRELISTTKNNSILAQKLDVFPTNIQSTSHKGGEIIFNETDTTISYIPPIDYEGVDGFYYWAEKPVNSVYAYQALSFVPILIENPNLSIEMTIQYNEYEYVLVVAVTIQGEPFTEYQINVDDQFTFSTFTQEMGISLEIIAFSVLTPDGVYLIEIEEDGSTNYINAIATLNYYYHYCETMDTIAVYNDHIEVSIPLEFSHIRMCGSHLITEIIDEVVYDETTGNSLFDLPTNQDICFELINYTYNNVGIRTFPIWNNLNSSNYEPTPLNCKILLEGAYTQNGLMSSDYYAQDLLPASQPFNQEPWHYTGAETLTASAPNIIDWVLVELRKGIPNLSEQNTATIERKAGILLDNGDIVSPDDLNSPLIFDKVLLGEDYYIAVRHRNHLDVFSSAAIIANGSLSYDFTQDPASALGTEQLKDLGDGFYGLYAGDFQVDGTIQVTDYDAWFIDPAVLNIYAPTDANLDGVIQVTDYDAWFANKAKLGVGEVRF